MKKGMKELTDYEAAVSAAATRIYVETLRCRDAHGIESNVTEMIDESITDAFEIVDRILDTTRHHE